LPRAEEGEREIERERERVGDGKRGDGRKRIYLYFAHPQDAPGTRVATRCARLPRGGGGRDERAAAGERVGGINSRRAKNGRDVRSSARRNIKVRKPA